MLQTSTRQARSDPCAPSNVCNSSTTGNAMNRAGCNARAADRQGAQQVVEHFVVGQQDVRRAFAHVCLQVMTFSADIFLLGSISRRRQTGRRSPCHAVVDRWRWFGETAGLIGCQGVHRVDDNRLTPACDAPAQWLSSGNIKHLFYRSRYR